MTYSPTKVPLMDNTNLDLLHKNPSQPRLGCVTFHKLKATRSIHWLPWTCQRARTLRICIGEEPVPVEINASTGEW